MMYSLKGVFPEPKKEQKKNFIRENMKQLKLIQGKSSKEPRFQLKNVHNPVPASSSISQLKTSTSNKSAKNTLNFSKTNSGKSRKKHPLDLDIQIKKGDMSEFLKRKELRQTKPVEYLSEEDSRSSKSSGQLRDIGCQTVESNLVQKLENTKLTVIHPKGNAENVKSKACGDNVNHRSPPSSPPRCTNEDLSELEHNRTRLNAILERKDNKDPYLPSGYQKGVVPKYIRERKDQIAKEADSKLEADQTLCPPGHVTLPDAERKETLRMLRNSFAELVNELNKMPVKTDTLRMRNRKMELEKQLTKLEEGIKVFSRPKVFVKIGE